MGIKSFIVTLECVFWGTRLMSRVYSGVYSNLKKKILHDMAVHTLGGSMVGVALMNIFKFIDVCVYT